MNQISRPSSGRFPTTKISLKIHLKTRKTARKRRTTKHRLEMEIAHQPSSNVGGTGGLVQHVAMMAVRVTVKATGISSVNHQQVSIRVLRAQMLHGFSPSIA